MIVVVVVSENGMDMCVTTNHRNQLCSAGPRRPTTGGRRGLPENQLRLKFRLRRLFRQHLGSDEELLDLKSQCNLLRKAIEALFFHLHLQNVGEQDKNNSEHPFT